jgi:asparagine synthase (glutamine-hydrolysing)
MNQDDAASLLQKPWHTEKLSENLVESISPLTGSGLNEILRNDLRLVLPNDMLFKTDSMSMSAGLEVRVPLLDHQLVDFVASLPGDYKVLKGTGKRILRDAFPDMIPESVLNRPKHGFEVPLGKWFAGPLRSMVDELTQDSFLTSQKVFNPETVRNIRSKALSGAPGDSIYHLWEIIVFQHWWKKYVC